jgi:hypothetical protein
MPSEKAPSSSSSTSKLEAAATGDSVESDPRADRAAARERAQEIKRFGETAGEARRVRATTDSADSGAAKVKTKAAPKGKQSKPSTKGVGSARSTSSKQPTATKTVSFNFGEEDDSATSGEESQPTRDDEGRDAPFPRSVDASALEAVIGTWVNIGLSAGGSKEESTEVYYPTGHGPQGADEVAYMFHCVPTGVIGSLRPATLKILCHLSEATVPAGSRGRDPTRPALIKALEAVGALEADGDGDVEGKGTLEPPEDLSEPSTEELSGAEGSDSDLSPLTVGTLENLGHRWNLQGPLSKAVKTNDARAKVRLILSRWGLEAVLGSDDATKFAILRRVRAKAANPKTANSASLDRAVRTLMGAPRASGRQATSATKGNKSSPLGTERRSIRKDRPVRAPARCESCNNVAGERFHVGLGANRLKVCRRCLERDQTALFGEATSGEDSPGEDSDVVLLAGRQPRGPGRRTWSATDVREFVKPGELRGKVLYSTQLAEDAPRSPQAFARYYPFINRDEDRGSQNLESLSTDELRIALLCCGLKATKGGIAVRREKALQRLRSALWPARVPSWAKDASDRHAALLTGPGFHAVDTDFLTDSDGQDPSPAPPKTSVPPRPVADSKEGDSSDASTGAAPASKKPSKNKGRKSKAKGNRADASKKKKKKREKKKKSKSSKKRGRRRRGRDDSSTSDSEPDSSDGGSSSSGSSDTSSSTSSGASTPSSSENCHGRPLRSRGVGPAAWDQLHTSMLVKRMLRVNRRVAKASKRGGSRGLLLHQVHRQTGTTEFTFPSFLAKLNRANAGSTFQSYVRTSPLFRGATGGRRSVETSKSSWSVRSRRELQTAAVCIDFLMSNGPAPCCCRKKKCREQESRLNHLKALGNVMEAQIRRFNALCAQNELANAGEKGTKSWMVASKLESASCLDLDVFVTEEDLRAARASVVLQMDVGSAAKGAADKGE